MAQTKKIKWDRKTGPAENARRELPKLAHDYFAEMREALAGDPEPADLHPTRLASKRFRYALELFRPCYAAGLEERIEQLKELQDLLGDCNDAVTAAGTVDEVLKGRTAEGNRLRRYLNHLAAEKAAEFRKHWTEKFDASGQEEWWAGYLARNARPPVKEK